MASSTPAIALPEAAAADMRFAAADNLARCGIWLSFIVSPYGFAPNGWTSDRTCQLSTLSTASTPHMCVYVTQMLSIFWDLRSPQSTGTGILLGQHCMLPLSRSLPACRHHLALQARCADGRPWPRARLPLHPQRRLLLRASHRAGLVRQETPLHHTTRCDQRPH